MKGKHLFMVILFLLGIFWIRGLMGQTVNPEKSESIKITYQVGEHPYQTNSGSYLYKRLE